jgi:hypothetical protein
MGECDLCMAFAGAISSFMWLLCNEPVWSGLWETWSLLWARLWRSLVSSQVLHFVTYCMPVYKLCKSWIIWGFLGEHHCYDLKNIIMCLWSLVITKYYMEQGCCCGCFDTSRGRGTCIWPVSFSPWPTIVWSLWNSDTSRWLTIHWKSVMCRVKLEAMGFTKHML